MSGLRVHLPPHFWDWTPPFQKSTKNALAPPFLKIFKFWLHIISRKFYCAQKRSDKFFSISTSLTPKMGQTGFLDPFNAIFSKTACHFLIKLTQNIVLIEYYLCANFFHFLSVWSWDIYHFIPHFHPQNPFSAIFRVNTHASASCRTPFDSSRWCASFDGTLRSVRFFPDFLWFF